jgi:ABC-2 type transport system permease protein
MRERIYTLLVKELLQVLRDPRMRTVIFLAPLIQLIIFGYAVTMDVKNIRTAVCDLDRTPESRELLSRFFASGYFKPVEYVSHVNRIQHLMDRGRTDTAIQINRGFSAKLAANEKASIQMILDGTDSNTASIVMAYTAQIIQKYNRDLTVEAMGLPEETSLNKGVDLRSRAWFNVNLESRMFFVPGVVALIGMIIMLLLTSMAIVREREVGTMEQLIVTPIRPVELILGKLIPFGLIGLFDMALIMVVAVFWFGIPMKGSPFLLFISTLLFLLPTLGTGLFISAISTTQQQAMMTTFFFAFPAILLSGFVFPISSMPEIAQWVTYANPLRYFIVIIRAIFLKGVGIEVLWPHLTAMGVLGVLIFILSSLKFTKRLE